MGEFILTLIIIYFIFSMSERSKWVEENQTCIRHDVRVQKAKRVEEVLATSSTMKGVFRIGFRNSSITQFCKNCRQHCLSPHVSFSSSTSILHDAYIALGSNMGDRVYNINAGKLILIIQFHASFYDSLAR